MGKRISIIVAVLIIAMLAGTMICFADEPIRSDRSIVINSLPDVTVYLETDMDYEISEENIEVYVNDSRTDLQRATTFEKAEEGAAYFILVDISKSISEEEMELVKQSILKFSEMLSEKDRILLIPFGEAIYSDKRVFTPSSDEFKSAVAELAVKDDYTQLYAAIDSVVGITETGTEEELPDRKIAMIFSDGADDTTGGLITREEAVVRMNNAGIPLYAFAVGNDKEGKDALGVLSRNINGSLRNIESDNAETTLEGFKNIIDSSLLIEAKVRNSEDIADTFNIRIMKDGQELLTIENVKAHKHENSKDVFLVALKKKLTTYWWIIALFVIAVIAAVVLHVIKRNRGVVNVDGRIVYGSQVQKKYHIKSRKNSIEMIFSVSINGGPFFDQQITLVESLIVGRANTCDVCFDDVTMSRQHFSLELTNEGLFVNDLESTSGTYLNGVRIYSRQRVSSGDVVNAGKTKIRLTWS